MIGLISGSGLFYLPCVKNIQWITVETPFGAPSDQLMLCELNGCPLVFLPRHGRGHVLSPSRINYRANIFALKKIGVKQILSNAP